VRRINFYNNNYYYYFILLKVGTNRKL